MSAGSLAMVQSLAAVKEAVAEALRAAGQALAAGSASVAQNHWQQAHAAMQVVDHRALIKFGAELGALIGAEDVKADRAAAFNAGADALIEYVASLIAGRRDQPLRLWPAYQALQQVRGVTQPAQSDLFFPLLEVNVPDAVGAAPAGADELRAARRMLEGGLLSWLRKGERGGLQAIADAVNQLTAMRHEPHARRLWWAAAGVLDALLNDGLEADAAARKFVTQLNLHLGRVLQGQTQTPEALLRDALFIAARARPVTPRIEGVQQAFALRGALDLDDAAPAGFGAEALAVARNAAQGMQALWSSCVAGSGAFTDFEQRARVLAQACEPLGELSLRALVEQLADTARHCAQPGATLNTPGDALALEGACALLMIEQVLAADHAPDAAFAGRAANMTARLKLAMQSPQDLAAAPPVQLLDDASLTAQAEQHAAAAHAEIARDLHDIEVALETWFGNMGDAALLGNLDKPFRRIAGAFSVLSHADAARLAGDCRAEVARYAQGAACGEAEGQALARRITVLTSFVDALKQGPADLQSVVSRLSVTMPMTAVIAQPAAVTEVAAEPPAVEAVAAAAPVIGDVLASVPEVGVPRDDASGSDAEMLEIFLEEASEVLGTIADVAPKSSAAPADQELLVTLRRAFHTLKGSGRMVGLKNFGEAAWEMEQVFNEMAPEQRPGTPDLYRLVDQAHDDFTRWITALRGDKVAAIDAARLTDWARKLRAGEALPAEPVSAPAAAPLPEIAPPAAEPAPAEVPPMVQIGDIQVSRSLYDIMLPEARQTLATLRQENLALQSGGHVSAEYVRAVHTLSGISGTAGFTAIRALGQSLERVADAAANAGAQLKPDERALADRALAALAQQVADVEAERAPAERADLAAALDALEILAVRAAPVEAAPVEAVPVPPVPAVPDVPAPELPALTQTLATAGGEPMPEPPLVAPQPVSAALAPVPAAPTPAAVRPVLTAAPDLPQGERRQYRLNDDIDAQLLPIFLEEAAELVPQVGQDLRAWRARPEDKLVAQSLKRLLHTLKGSARMAGAMALGQLTHSMESRIENAQRLPAIPEHLIDELETSFDRIGVLINNLHEGEAAGTATRVTELPPAIDQMTRTMQIATASGAMNQTMLMPAPGGAEAEAGLAPGVPRPMIRVRADLIDRLANQAGEVSIARARVSAELRSARTSLRELTENVSRLRAQLRELEIQAETQMQSRFAADPQQGGEKFDPLEFDRFTRLQELTRLMAESVNDVATVQHSLVRDLDEGEKALAAQAQVTRDVQQDLMAIRMVPFASISDRLYRVTRLSAKDSEKRVGLDIIGEQVEVDRGVMDRIAAPIEHLLRNAIVHGIEPPRARVEAGKPEAGSLKLEVRQEGNEVVLTLADDGAGLNIERIRDKAISLGMMREDEQLTDQQIGNFIFRSGFSTAEAVTAEAGRGVGMDVVMSEVIALGGRVNTQSERGQGTTFTIHLPLTLSVLQAVVMRLGGSYFAVPTMMVEQVQRLKSEVLAAANAAREIEWQGSVYPFHHLATLLEMGGDDEAPQYGSVLLLRSGNNRCAIQVDDIIGGQEIVIKNIGPQIARVPGITGAAVLGSGETVLILNPVLLSVRYLQAVEAAAREIVSVATQALPAVPPEPERQRTVLVVDDSLTVRKITDRLLTREGYRVLVAKDGVEALEKIRDQLPDVMITDVEMPRMDGFDLAKNVRTEDALKHLPIIMITSRTADKHRQHALELGVDVFLGKPYEESELLGHIATLARRPVTA